MSFSDGALNLCMVMEDGWVKGLSWRLTVTHMLCVHVTADLLPVIHPGLSAAKAKARDTDLICPPAVRRREILPCRSSSRGDLKLGIGPEDPVAVDVLAVVCRGQC